MDTSLFKKYEKIETKITNRRQLIISDILNEINKERPTTYKDKNNKKVTIPKIKSRVSIMRFCMKIAHVSEDDLFITHRNCLKNKLEKGKDYSYYFFGSLKPVDK